MKTKLKRVFVAPLLCLALFTVMIPTAEALPYEKVVVEFCTQVVYTPSGPSNALGAKVICKPALAFWCSPQKCAIPSSPQQ